ncbi:MAG: DUF2905 domain-containing protein [Deltaproteobacteria bacterium]|nr:MAG: DUF2905 domain-containing protein [Deltaproteobacteria bacterium]
MTFGKLLVVLGVLLVAVGLLVQLAPQIPLLGKLPGDIRIERGGVRVYFPITTCVLLSVVLTLLLRLFSGPR